MTPAGGIAVGYRVKPNIRPSRNLIYDRQAAWIAHGGIDLLPSLENPSYVFDSHGKHPFLIPSRLPIDLPPADGRSRVDFLTMPGAFERFPRTRPGLRPATIYNQKMCPRQPAVL
jgi:hypothetical protein